MARGRVAKAQKFIFQKFSRKQKQVLKWWMPGSPYADYDGIIADGAIRSGKTVSLALSFVIWAMDSFNGESFAMCGKTIGAFRRNVLAVLLPMLVSGGYQYDHNRSENTLMVTCRGRTNTFYIFGGKDERSQDLIQGLTLAGVFFDEVALMPESFVQQATARCSVEGSKWCFNCNPEGPHHWFKVDWIDKAGEKHLFYLHFTMDDNLSLSEKIKARYRAMYTGVFMRRFIDGLWTIAEGLIYDMFDPQVHVLAERPPDSDFDGLEKKYITVDYGTQNATAYLLWEKLKTGVWLCTKLYYYSGRDEQRQKTDAQYADDLEAWIPTGKDGKRIPIAEIIVDPSAASFIAELKQRGFRVKHARNDVLDGIRSVATALNLKRIAFVAECTDVIREFEQYTWDEKAVQRGEDAPKKEYDHGMDAVRYFVYTKLAKKQVKANKLGGSI